MAEIVLTNVTKHWGSFYAVDNMNLYIGDNAFITLLGPSGCGKTTTLRMIAGLETPTSGKISIDGEVVFDSEQGINIPANKRNVGFLFQNYALWPNMTVYQNISFGLTNVKELMPDVDFDAAKLTKLSTILNKTKELVELINSCLDKNKKQDSNKLMIRLIDKYEISQFTAKEIMGYNLEKNEDFEEKAKTIKANIDSKLQSIISKHKQNSVELNEKFELVKNGELLKSVRKLSKEEIDLNVRRVSRIVKIGMFMDRYPSELSGGQQQRVAIARTLAPKPKVLFMDEPLSNLDAKLRLEMRSELQRLHVETGSTFIYVTHDQMEAMTLATQICLIDNGVVQQYAEPLALYNKPNNLFCADFVGNPSINFIDAKLLANKANRFEIEMFDGIKAEFVVNGDVDFSKFKIEAEKERENQEQEEKQKKVEKANKITVFEYHISKVNEFEEDSNTTKTDDDLVLGIRPEFLSTEEASGIEAEVFSAMPTGMETTLRLKIANYLITGVVFGDKLFKLDQKIMLNFKGENLMLFHRKSGKLIALGKININ